MAKSSKSDKTERQKVLDEVRKKQKGAEKRRGYMIVGVCVVFALLIVAAAAYRPIVNWWELRQFKDLDLASIGAPADVCGDIETKKANGSSEHLPTGSQLTYDDAPPAFGPHWNEGQESGSLAPVPISSKFYDPEEDRPELEQLVHNLEHGYTIVWYDETIADDNDALNELRGIAAKLDADDDNFRNKFKAVPWGVEDAEAAFPEGQHIALTHWSIEGEGEGGQGVFQYCSEVSGEALEDFMIEYPYTDSPEPNAG